MTEDNTNFEDALAKLNTTIPPLSEEWFDALGAMEETRQERQMARYEDPGRCIIDTSLVFDAEPPWEVAVSHIAYRGGSWMIVERHPTWEEAQTAHDRWVATMTGELPDAIHDIYQNMDFPREGNSDAKE